MIIKKENEKIFLKTEKLDQFERADSRLIQVINKIIRKFKNDVESVLDSEVAYNKGSHRVILIKNEKIKNEISFFVRTCGVNCHEAE